MTLSDIVRQRLTNEQFTRTTFRDPGELVAWFGAVQSQDYGAAKWALGQRLPDATDPMIEDAFTKGDILRTHIMRPTWHFVSRKDIRWMQMLTAPRVNAVSAYYFRKMGLDDEVFKRSQTIMTKALQGGKQLTRTELGTVLQKNGIATKELALAYIVIRAELDALICSGPRRGKQFTYMLLDERVPQTKTLTKDEALIELIKRYFTSHGPATVKDFIWWSGLTFNDAKNGINMLKPAIANEVVGEKIYWFFPTKSFPVEETTYLLPNYDEYTIAYKDREAFFNEQHVSQLDTRANVVFANMIIYKGIITGMWRRTLNKNSVLIEPKFFTQPSTAEYASFATAAERYGKFLSLKAIYE